MKTTIVNNTTSTETLKTIFERRAVRKYLPDMIDDELLEKIIDAGRMAPSAMNGQPWKFYVATHKDTISLFSKAIANLTPKVLFKNALKHPVATIKTLLHELPHAMHSESDDPIFHEAPVVIFITSPRDNEWAGLDIGMCAQNMMLAAKSLGLDSCPVGFAKYIAQTPVYHKLGIPSAEDVQLAVIIGYGAEKPEPHPRVKNNAIFVDRLECC
jgi:nitroreductase